MLVFGLETTFRSLQSTAFSSQGRWHVLVRIIGVLLLTIITGIPSLVLPASGQCLASFIWSTAHYAKPGVVIGLTLIFAYITCASVITFQLMTTSKLHSDQRIQASRIVYYLLVSTLLLVSQMRPKMSNVDEMTVFNRTFLCSSDNVRSCHHYIEDGRGSSESGWDYTGAPLYTPSI